MSAIGEATHSGGIDVRRIVADGATGPVPGLLHTPADRSEPLPLLLVGHGGGGGKDDERISTLCRRFAVALGAGVLVIDGPVHGERAPRDGTQEENFRTARRALVDPETPARFTQDWRAAIDAVDGVDGIDTSVLGYAGFSMGVLLGVPVVAGLGGVRAAVFGVGGVPVPGGVGRLVLETLGNEEAARVIDEEDDAELRGRIVLEAAARLTGTEVLMVNTTEDVVFPPDAALELFRALPGSKRIAFWPGSHVELPPEAIALAAAFLRRHLRGEGADAEGPEGPW